MALFSPDGKWLTGLANGTVQIWQVPHGRQEGQLPVGDVSASNNFAARSQLVALAETGRPSDGVNRLPRIIVISLPYHGRNRGLYRQIVSGVGNQVVHGGRFFLRCLFSCIHDS
jgi:hypothetical protein